MAPPSSLQWLAGRPIAHRGLHGTGPHGADGGGPVENSLGAARAAMARGFAIECDVQLTQDCDAVVFHDFTLDRLTAETGAVVRRRAAELAGLPYRRGSDRLALLTTLLDEIAGRVPLICEIKSRFDGDLRLAERVRAVASAYAGPLALKSFDPEIIAYLRRAGTSCPLGVVAQADYDARGDEWSHLPPANRRDLAALAHFGDTRPDFLSYRVGDLPHAGPLLCRSALGIPVVTWTVRDPDQVSRASRWADQIIFEGFMP